MDLHITFRFLNNTNYNERGNENLINPRLSPVPVTWIKLQRTQPEQHESHIPHTTCNKASDLFRRITLKYPVSAWDIECLKYRVYIKHANRQNTSMLAKFNSTYKIYVRIRSFHLEFYSFTFLYYKYVNMPLHRSYGKQACFRPNKNERNVMKNLFTNTVLS